MSFIKTGSELIPIDRILSVDYSKIEQLELVVWHDGSATMEYFRDNFALDAAMILCPSIVEGKRFKWARNAWLVHNIIGHPLMQVLAFFGFYKLAFKIHDSTIPRPLGKKE